MIAGALEGQRAGTGSNLQDRLNEVWDPFATEGMFTGSLHGGRVYLRLAFLIPRQGGAGAVPPTQTSVLAPVTFKVNPRTMHDQTSLTQFKTHPPAAGSFGGPSGENPEGGMDDWGRGMAGVGMDVF